MNGIIRITFVVCLIMAVRCSIRYSFLEAVGEADELISPVTISVDKPLLSNTTAITFSKGSAQSAHTSMQHPHHLIRIHSDNSTHHTALSKAERRNHTSADSINNSKNRNTFLSPIPSPGTRVYDESLEFMQKLMGLGLEQWEQYLKLKKGKRFDSDLGSKFTQKIYGIAAEVLTMPSTIPPLDDTTLKPPVIHQINCADPKYFNAFTGKLDPNGDKIIVDWTMVGWDHDFTEIRLAEYGDLIDRLVLFDIDTTLKGLPKPIIMPKILKERFQHLYANKIDYQLLRNFTAEAFPDGKKEKIGYHLQIKLRNRGRDYMKDLYKNHTARNRVFVIQNDGDEIMTRESLMHVIKCELQKPDEILFAPAVNFKVRTGYDHIV